MYMYIDTSMLKPNTIGALFKQLFLVFPIIGQRPVMLKPQNVGLEMHIHRDHTSVQMMNSPIYKTMKQEESLFQAFKSRIMV